MASSASVDKFESKLADLVSAPRRVWGVVSLSGTTLGAALRGRRKARRKANCDTA